MTWQPYDSRGRPNTPKSNPKDVAQLAEPLRSRAHQMIVDCPYKGELGVVSGLRDPGTQWDLRLGRVGLANIWNSAIQGSPTTAIPARWNGTAWVGGSRHQVGTAVDFGGTERAMVWMHDNRERYGLARTVPSERWHMEPNRVDSRTGRVHDNPTAPITPFGAPTPKPEPPKPEPKPEPSEENEMRAYRFADHKVWACNAHGRRHITSREQLNELAIVGLIAPVPKDDLAFEDTWVRKANKSAEAILSKLPVVK